MNMTSIAVVVLALCVTACGDGNNKAVGLYKHSSNFTGTDRIVEVKKDGDTYLFIEDVIGKSNAIALTKTADGLSYNNMPLKVSEDGKTLYFGPVNATRVDTTYLSEQLANIEKNKKICESLKIEAKANKGLATEQWNKYIETVKSRKPANCYVDAYMRF